MSTSAASPAARERELNSTSLLTAIVVLAIVTMTFGAMIAVFFVRSQAPVYWGRLHLPGILWFTTAILLASSVTLERGRRALLLVHQPLAFRSFVQTSCLAGLFLAGQLFAWFQVLHSGIVLAQNPHSWFIFLFTALHGLHILLGMAGLLWLVTRTRQAASGPRFQMTTRVAANGVAIFWHYLDFLWVVLFTLLLLWHRE